MRSPTSVSVDLGNAIAQFLEVKVLASACFLACILQAPIQATQKLSADDVRRFLRRKRKFSLVIVISNELQYPAPPFGC